jgi:hypothetical protein
MPSSPAIGTLVAGFRIEALIGDVRFPVGAIVGTGRRRPR